MKLKVIAEKKAFDKTISSGRHLIEYKKTLKLSKLQRQIIIGVLLGNASIVKQRCKNSCNDIKFEQCLSKAEYVYNLYDHFKDWVRTEPKIRFIKGGQANDRFSLWFRTYRHKSLNYYYNVFYVNSKKKVPKFIYKLITPVSLAYWYMDDGTKWKNGYVLNTQAFELHDQKKLLNVLNKKFGLDVQIYRDRKFYLIFIKNIEQFNYLVKPYIIDSMKYKLH
jgi:hypothetical protein